VLGLQLVYALSAIGRSAGALTFTTLKEPYEYPSTLRKELSSIRANILTVKSTNLNYNSEASPLLGENVKVAD